MQAMLRSGHEKNLDFPRSRSEPEGKKKRGQKPRDRQQRVDSVEKVDPERTLVHVSSGPKALRAPLLQRNIHICLPLILRCLGIDAQVIEEQRLVTQFLSTGRKPIAVNRIDRFADVIR